MLLLGKEVLNKSMRRHPDTRKWLAQWVEIVEDAEWRSIHDARVDYPSADGVKLQSDIVVTIFNVEGNECRLLTYVSYSVQTIEVLDLMTHAEYGRDRWKQRY
jgi:mRNA interferase HigB